MAKKSNSTATTTPKRCGRKVKAKKAGDEAALIVPPSMERQFKQNKSYYDQVEFFIWRSINGSKW